MLFQKSDSLGNFLRISRVRKHDTTGIFYLIKEELAEILEIHLAFVGIDNCAKSIELSVFHVCMLNGADDVGKLSDAGRFDDNAVRRIFCSNFFECFGEVAYQCTADTSRIHFGNFDAGIFQKSAVDANFAEFIFDQDDLFAPIDFLNEFFDERRLSCT